MGRPTIAVLLDSIQSGRVATSFACIGNRVYTGLGDDEGHYAMPGAKVADVVSKLAVIVEANRQLEAFHKSRAAREPKSRAGPGTCGSPGLPPGSPPALGPAAAPVTP